MSKLVIALVGVVLIMLLWLVTVDSNSYDWVGHAIYYEWVELTGPWVLTHYGTEEDGYLGRHTGAYWNGIDALDWTNPGELMPEVITLEHNCIAMPGPEFYGLPVLVCVEGSCVLTTAVDSPAAHRVWIDGDYYMHADLCHQPAVELDIVGSGVVTGANVYVGRYTGGDETWLSESNR